MEDGCVIVDNGDEGNRYRRGLGTVVNAVVRVVYKQVRTNGW